jgi:hypothetical protein
MNILSEVRQHIRVNVAVSDNGADGLIRKRKGGGCACAPIMILLSHATCASTAALKAYS